MRIPLYRTQAIPTSEAPGRSIRARMSMEPFVQEAMSRGAVVGEALKQVGEYAKMRYDLATQEKLDNALLRAEEELRTTARDMENRNMVGNVLDGDNPLWNQSVNDMRGRLQAELGRDRRANAVFNERFGQMELTQRFSLRGAIDAKLERQAAAAREQRLTQAENDIANGTDIAKLNLILGQIGVDSSRLAQFGIGNPDALKAQEYALLKNGTERAAMTYLNEQDLSITAASQLHEALQSGDPTNITDSRGFYVYNLMEKLRPEDRVAILRKVNGISEYVNGPSLEQERRQIFARQAASDVGGQISSAKTLIERGGQVNDQTIDAMAAVIDNVSPAMTPEQDAALRRDFASMVALRGLSQDIKPLNQRQLSDLIQSFGQPENADQVEALEFLRRYRDNRNNQIAKDAMGWAFESGFAKPVDIDLSPEAIDAGQTNVDARLSVGQNLRAQFNLDYTPVLTNDEVTEIAGRIMSSPPIDAVTSMMDLRDIMGVGGYHALEQLRRAGVPFEYALAMGIDDPGLRQNVANLASVSVADLQKQAETTASTDVRRKMRELLQPLMSAYLTGGDGDAARMLNQHLEVAEKLALSTMTQAKVDPIEAAEFAVQRIFPAYENVVQNNHGNFIVPTQFDSDEIDAMTEQLLNAEALGAAGIAPETGASFFLPVEDGAQVSPEIVQDLANSVEEALSIASLADSGIWLMNSAGDGVVLHYNLSGYYLPVRLKNGNFYDVKFSQMRSWLDGLTAKPDVSGGYTVDPMMIAP